MSAFTSHRNYEISYLILSLFSDATELYTTTNGTRYFPFPLGAPIVIQIVYTQDTNTVYGLNFNWMPLNHSPMQRARNDVLISGQNGLTFIFNISYPRASSSLSGVYVLCWRTSEASPILGDCGPRITIEVFSKFSGMIF